MGIFDKRTAYKPFEYPKVLEFTDKIIKTFWVHNEIEFTADRQDFQARLSEPEKEAIKRSLLAISQIEVAVKSFWGDLYKHLPKPEFNGLGASFAECEFRHSQAYSRLLEELGYNNEFKNLIEVPVIKKRIDYLNKGLQHARSDKPEEYVYSLILFAILIENVSLFSQFAIILSFTRFNGVMKNVSNIISWTSVDEQIHGLAGIYIVKQIMEEYPAMLTEELKNNVRGIVVDSIDTEVEILDWIFEKGEIKNVKKHDLINFMKYRADNNLKAIGLDSCFRVKEEEYRPLRWFEEEILADTLDDFFAKRPTDYTKKKEPVSPDDLF